MEPDKGSRNLRNAKSKKRRSSQNTISADLEEIKSKKNEEDNRSTGSSMGGRNKSSRGLGGREGGWSTTSPKARKMSNYSQKLETPLD